MNDEFSENSLVSLRIIWALAKSGQILGSYHIKSVSVSSNEEFFFKILFIYLFIYLFLLFNYSCLHFLSIPPPHPSQSHLPPPPPP